MNDPIIDEVRSIKDELAARFNYDLKAIYEDIKRREKEREAKTGCKFVSYPPRRVEPPADGHSNSAAAPVEAASALPQATRRVSDQTRA